MNEAMKFAGTLAAHAIWCVSNGDTLIPMFGHLNATGERVLNRLAHDRLEDAVAAGKRQLDQPPPDTPFAVLLYDGFITLGDWRTDAIMVDIRCYKRGNLHLLMAVPYKPKRGWFSRFVVYKPKFVECSDPAADFQAIGEALFAGVDSHEKGAAIWNKHLDQSR